MEYRMYGEITAMMEEELTGLPGMREQMLRRRAGVK